VLIVGAGLAGSLLALALRELDQPVTLIDRPDPGPTATTASYGVLPGFPLGSSPLARQVASAADLWRALQSRYGDLGWSPRQRLPVPLSQVDSSVLERQLPALLERLGVEQVSAEVQGLERCGDRWRLHCSAGAALEADQLVLAAGAGCRGIWPQLPAPLRCSWAGVLALPHWPSSAGSPALHLPARFRRPQLERRAPQLRAPEAVVDAGLVPRGEGALLGQISWIDGALECGPAPDPGRSEALLRAALPAQWAALQGRWLQMPVAFCSDGLPLVGPVPGAPGLFCFSGFSGAFAQVPLLAPLLAQFMAGSPGAEAALQRLQVWAPARSAPG
jgi:glycine/D-amino acid oxidase-like deaminating enzyme